MDLILSIKKGLRDKSQSPMKYIIKYIENTPNHSISSCENKQYEHHIAPKIN